MREIGPDLLCFEVKVLMTTLLWIRHTEHELGSRVIAGRRPDVSLSEKGRRDAAALAERLAGHPIRAIYRSPMQRTGETAAPLAARLNLEPRILPEVDEVDFGSWTGKSLDELDPLPAWQQWNALRSTARPPGGETMLEVQARIAAAVEKLRSTHDGEMSAVFCHGDVIRAAVALALGVHIDLFLRIEIGLGSVSAVRLPSGGGDVEGGGGAPRVMCVNALSQESVLGF